MTSPEVRTWWAQQLTLEKYVGSTKHLYIWNDMNEPSVFNGPEVSEAEHLAAGLNDCHVSQPATFSIADLPQGTSGGTVSQYWCGA